MGAISKIKERIIGQNLLGGEKRRNREVFTANCLFFHWEAGWGEEIMERGHVPDYFFRTDQEIPNWLIGLHFW